MNMQPRRIDALETLDELLAEAGDAQGLGQSPMPADELGHWVGDTLPEAKALDALETADHMAGVDPLDHLHREYLATLADPQHAEARDWLTLAGGASSPLDDAFDSLREIAANTEGDPGLYGLIEQPQPIDALLDSWDIGIGDPELLTSEGVAANVLHLFAPESLRAPDSADATGDDAALLRQLAGEPMPELTRKQHHDMALDSAPDSLHFSTAVVDMERQA